MSVPTIHGQGQGGQEIDNVRREGATKTIVNATKFIKQNRRSAV